MKLARALESQIREYIKRNGLKVGDRLEPERTLAVTFGVSRSSLRHALQRLATVGVLEIRPGSGVYVAEPGIKHFLRLSAQSSHEDIDFPVVLEARIILEPEMARLAARRADPEDIARGREALRQMAIDLDSKGTYSVEHDATFHLALARATHNRLLEGALAYLYQFNPDTLWRMSRNHLLNQADVAQEFYRDHEAVLDAIALRRGGKAALLMRNHSQKMLDLMVAEAAEPQPGDTSGASLP